ncbi:hypothetical protein, partial [Serratia marcescens]|uniref:hypothetical protein n=1 Tax=Serratia marcescens TaxID=615 RepID=UPI001954AB84
MVFGSRLAAWSKKTAKRSLLEDVFIGIFIWATAKSLRPISGGIWSSFLGKSAKNCRLLDDWLRSAR